MNAEGYVPGNAIVARLPDDERGILAAEFAWEFAIQLARLRQRRGLSQAELAQLMGVRQETISRYENPEYDHPNLRPLRKIAENLHAYVDLVIVPHEDLEDYFTKAYLPLIDSHTDKEET